MERRGRMQMYLAIGTAGAIGTLLRYSIGVWTQNYLYESFPLGTLICNLLGCLILGWLSYYILVKHIDKLLGLALMTGLIGSFTTFSALSIEMMEMLYAEKWIMASSYLMTSLIGGLLFVWLGYKAAVIQFAGSYSSKESE